MKKKIATLCALAVIAAGSLAATAEQNTNDPQASAEPQITVETQIGEYTDDDQMNGWMDDWMNDWMNDSDWMDCSGQDQTDSEADAGWNGTVDWQFSISAGNSSGSNCNFNTGFCTGSNATLKDLVEAGRLSAEAFEAMKAYTAEQPAIGEDVISDFISLFTGSDDENVTNVELRIHSEDGITVTDEALREMFENGIITEDTYNTVVEAIFPTCAAETKTDASGSSEEVEPAQAETEPSEEAEPADTTAAAEAETVAGNAEAAAPDSDIPEDDTI